MRESAVRDANSPADDLFFPVERIEEAQGLREDGVEYQHRKTIRSRIGYHEQINALIRTITRVELARATLVAQLGPPDDALSRLRQRFRQDADSALEDLEGRDDGNGSHARRRFDYDDQETDQ